VAARHLGLRASFAWDGDEAFQLFAAARSVPILKQRLDEESLTAALRDEASVPISLEGGLLFRVVLFQLAPEHHVLLIVVEHIACDDWSKHLIARDLAVAYSAAALGAPLPLTPGPVDYRAFVDWEQAELTPPRHDELLTYWLRHTKLPLHIDLPFATETASSVYDAAMLSRPASESIHSAVERIIHRDGVTTFVVALTALAIVLHRTTSRTSIPIRCGLLNRPFVGAMEIVGWCANTAFLCVPIQRHDELHTVLREARTAVVGALEYGAFPMQRLGRILVPESYGRPQPKPWAFLSVVERASELKLEGLDVDEISVEPTYALPGFTLKLTLDESGIQHVLSYGSEAISHHAASWLIDSFEVAINTMALAPEAAVSSVQIDPPPSG
jgi:Condensation domain